jgi:hypothetical protein
MHPCRGDVEQGRCFGTHIIIIFIFTITIISIITILVYIAIMTTTKSLLSPSPSGATVEAESGPNYKSAGLLSRFLTPKHFAGREKIFYHSKVRALLAINIFLTLSLSKPAS